MEHPKSKSTQPSRSPDAPDCTIFSEYFDSLLVITHGHLVSGTYQGQWLRGLRHGYGVRTSAAYGVATHFRGQHGNMRGSESSLNQTAGNPVKPLGIGAAAGAAGGAGGSTAGDETRGGFVLRTRSDPVPHRRRSLVERSGMKSFVQVGLSVDHVLLRTCQER